MDDVDLISIPEQVDRWRPTEEPLPVPFEGPVAQVVSFGELPTCWAHSPGHDAADCFFGNPSLHGCRNTGTGRLGLCSEHEREIIG